MKSATTRAVRAIAGTFARQIIVPILVIAAIVLLVLWLGLIILAMQVSLWWLLLLLVLIPATLLAGLIGAAAWFVVSKLTPSMTRTQKAAATRFVERVGTYSNIMGMSRYLIAFHIIRQVIQKKPRTYISELIGNSTELRDDFYALRDEFATNKRKVVRNLEEE